jgi:hypothetical protein
MFLSKNNLQAKIRLTRTPPGGALWRQNLPKTQKIPQRPWISNNLTEEITHDWINS